MKNLFLICALLVSGCVVHSQYYVDQTFSHAMYRVESSMTDASQYSHSETRPTDPPSVIVKTSPEPLPAPALNKGCRPFVLPMARAQPLAPNLADPSIKDQAIDALLAEYIKALIDHIETERLALENAYQAWLDECA